MCRVYLGHWSTCTFNVSQPYKSLQFYSIILWNWWWMGKDTLFRFWGMLKSGYVSCIASIDWLGNNKGPSQMFCLSPRNKGPKHLKNFTWVWNRLWLKRLLDSARLWLNWIRWRWFKWIRWRKKTQPNQSDVKKMHSIRPSSEKQRHEREKIRCELDARPSLACIAVVQSHANQWKWFQIPIWLVFSHAKHFFRFISRATKISIPTNVGCHSFLLLVKISHFKM